MSLLTSPLRFCLVLVACLALAACGGSGGGESNGNTTRSGSVGVFVTDAPSDEFSEILATVSRIQLLSDEVPHQTVFEGSQTIDLLDLQNYTEFFAVAEVPAVPYNKIRLYLDDLELVRRDATGAITEIIHPPLPANGKIDLNPRGTFTVPADDTLLLQLDIDVDKSIHIVETGGSEYRFRPIVFIDVLNDATFDKLSRLHGEVDSINATDNQIVLCEVRTITRFSHDGDSNCLMVQLNGDTSIFDASGDETTLDMVAVGDELTAVGYFARVDEDPMDDNGDDNEDASSLDDDLVLNAVVLQLGPDGTYTTLTGNLQNDLTALPNTVDFELSEAQQGLASGTVIDLAAAAGTRLLHRDGTVLTAADLTTGTNVSADGVLVLSDVDPDQLKAALLVVNPDTASEVVEGTVQTVDVDAQTMTVFDGSTDVCVRLDAATVFTVEAGSDESTEGELADITADAEVTVYGTEAVDSCIDADTVIVQL